MSYILENSDKKQRAQDILKLVLGQKAAVSSEEVERKGIWTRHLQGVDTKDTEAAVRFIYEKLGGRVITEEQKLKLRRTEETKKKRGKKDE